MTSHTIGYAAKAAGIKVDTVRYYEREGLLSKATRTACGYRLYAEADIERLRFIRQAKALGFTLDDITELLRFQDGEVDREQVRVLAKARIDDLTRKIQEMTAIRDALSLLEHDCCAGTAIAGCSIIEGVRSVFLKPTSRSENH